jgi:hypothetical protein
MEAEKKILSDGSKERKLIQINDAAEQAAKDKENADKRKEKAKEYAKNRLDAERTIKDIEISLIADETEREIAATNEKYRRLIEDVKKNETLTGKEKVRLTALYESQKTAELEKAAKVQADAEKKRQEDIAKGIKAFYEAEAAKEEEIQEQIYQAGLTEQQRELETNKYHYENLIAEAERYGLDAANLVEEQRAKEAEINKKYDEAERQAQLAKIEAEKQVRDAKIQAAGDAAQSLLNLSSLVIKDQKKLEQINKASALVQIGIDTAKAISALVAAANSNPFNGVTAGAAGIAQFASGILQITTNMVKAKQLLSNPSGNVSGGGGGGGGTSSGASAAALVPQINLFGQGNNLNTAGQTKSANATPSFVVQAVVSETDITNTQTKINKIKQGSEL